MSLRIIIHAERKVPSFVEIPGNFFEEGRVYAQLSINYDHVRVWAAYDTRDVNCAWMYEMRTLKQSWNAIRD